MVTFTQMNYGLSVNSYLRHCFGHGDIIYPVKTGICWCYALIATEEGKDSQDIDYITVAELLLNSQYSNVGTKKHEILAQLLLARSTVWRIIIF